MFVQWMLLNKREKKIFNKYLKPIYDTRNESKNTLLNTYENNTENELYKKELNQIEETFNNHLKFAYEDMKTDVKKMNLNV